jgi:hypothetical protein
MAALQVTTSVKRIEARTDGAKKNDYQSQCFSTLKGEI